MRRQLACKGLVTGALLLGSAAAAADSVTLAWQNSAGDEVAGYTLYVGEQSGRYTRTIDTGRSESFTVDGLQAGKTYFFNLKAYTSDRLLTSAFAGELSRTLAPPPAPEAAFSTSVSSGVAPLTVVFTDTSTGQIATRSWELGNGVRSTGTTAMTSYGPGRYTVTLRVDGPGGSDTLRRSALISVAAPPPSEPPAAEPPPLTDGDGGNHSLGGNGGNGLRDDGDAADDGAPTLPFEAEELLADQRWQRVSYLHDYVDPVVVVTSLNGDGALPMTVRVRAVDNDGFDIRVQPWDYLGDVELLATLSYIVVERGHYVLEDGTRVEAGWTDSARNGRIRNTSFQHHFDHRPLVMTTVASDFEADAVTPRVQWVNPYGFNVRLQEQEANGRRHVQERLGYLAWEPGAGSVDGWRYEASYGGIFVNHRFRLVDFRAGHAAPPLLFAATQTIASSDAATLRWRNKTAVGVELVVQEERSYDDETWRYHESVGFLALSPLN